MADNERTLWVGLPARVFYNPERAGNSRIQMVYGKDSGGRDEIYWEFIKPIGAGSNRAEFRNIAVNGGLYLWQENKTYTLRWKSKYSKMDTSGSRNVTVFQWKSYGANQNLNYPILLEYINGTLKLMSFSFPPGQVGAPILTTLWQRAVATGYDLDWNSYELTLHLSRNPALGWIEFWFNDVRQLLAGSERFYASTLDHGTNEPKWGVYTHHLQDVEISGRIKDVSVSEHIF